MRKVYVVTEKDLIIERETIYNRCSNAGLPTQADVNQIRKLLLDESFQRVIYAVLSESDAQGIVLLCADLTSPGGIANSLKLQGNAHGLKRAVDIIFDLAYSVENERKENSNE